MTCMTSRRPAKAATGKPPPDGLGKGAQVGGDAEVLLGASQRQAEAGEGLVKTISTPYRVHSSRSPSRKPGSGMQPVIFRVTGSMMTQAI